MYLRVTCLPFFVFDEAKRIVIAIQIVVTFLVSYWTQEMEIGGEHFFRLISISSINTGRNFFN